MAYRLRMRSEVLYFDDKSGKYVGKTALTDFKFKAASDMIVLLKNMAVYADEPLDFTIMREDD